MKYRVEKKPEKKGTKLSQLGIFIVAIAMLSGSLGYLAGADGPTGFGTVIEPGSMVQDATYVIFEDNGAYYAKSGETGAIIFTSVYATALFNMVFSNISDDGGKVKIKAGDYELNSAAFITKNNTLVEGEGGSTILRLVSGSTGGEYVYVLTNRISYGVPGSSNITVRDLCIDGNKDGQDGGQNGYNYLCFYAYGGEHLNFENVVFKNGYDGGLFFEYAGGTACAESIVSNCQFYNNGERQRGAIWIDGCGEGLKIINCYSEGDLQHGIHIGVSSPSHSDHIQIIGYTCISPGEKGIQVYSHACSDLKMDGVYILNAGNMGVDFWAKNGSFSGQIEGAGNRGLYVRAGSSNLTIEGKFAGSGWSNVEVVASRDIDLIGIKCLDGVAHGLQVYGSDNIRVIGGTFKNQATNQYGINIQNAADDIIINGAYCGDDKDIPTQKYGIYNTDGTNVTIIACIFEGNTFAAIGDPTSGATFFGNIGYVTENKGTATITTSTSVVFNHGLATTPTLVLASFSVASYGNYTWTATTTQITITVSTSGTYTVYWYAEV